MTRRALSVAVSMVGLTLCTAVAAQARLTEADRSKVVCVPVRDTGGAATGKQICKSGAQWESTLRVARQPALGQIPNAARWSALAGQLTR